MNVKKNLQNRFLNEHLSFKIDNRIKTNNRTIHIYIYTQFID